MKVIALGLRGLPGIAGGVESHCEHLYPLIAASGVDLEVVVRSAYSRPLPGSAWRNVGIRRIWSPKRSGVEVIPHTLLGVIYASIRRPDILHIHSIGPAVFVPLARMLGLKVVVTHHAPDYAQSKWGTLGKWILRTGERFAMRYANQVISVSRHGAADLQRRYGRRPVVIPNGVPFLDPTDQTSALEELGLQPGRYYLHVGRAIPEKRQDDLIRAYASLGRPDWKLVLVGNLSGPDEYSSRVRRLAAEHPGVVLAGYRTGTDLRALFTNAGCFCLPSTIEGFSIALLEALSAGCAVTASDIPANHEIELPAQCYFPAGNVPALANALASTPTGVPRNVWRTLQERVRREYDWSLIASETLRVYRRVLKVEGAEAGRRGRDTKKNSGDGDGKNLPLRSDPEP